MAKVFFDNWVLFALVLIFSYLMGCINSSIILTKFITKSEDIRNLGSGNAGFTNALRTKGLKYGAITFLMDFLKGFTAVWFSRLLLSSRPDFSNNESALISALYATCFACALGHIFPCFFGFRGGKGILTTWAAFLPVDFKIFISLICVFLVILAIVRIVSLASISAAFFLPFCVYFFGRGRESFSLVWVVIASVGSLIIIIKHSSNIKRILKGEEKRISIKNTPHE